jgi:hypothetical protein
MHLPLPLSIASARIASANVAASFDLHSYRCYHESLNNLIPADVYFGRGQTISLERERIRRRTIQHRRLMHHQNAA